MNTENHGWQIGLDEAGRGAVIGPLVIGCVAATPEGIAEMERIKVEDSKALNPTKREQIHESIISLSPEILRWEIIQASPEQIDRAVVERSLNELELDLFADAVAKIKHLEAGTIVADACDSNAERFGQRLSSRLLGHGINFPVLAEHKADLNHVVVAAASIVAKVARDRAIDVLSEEVDIQFGSGYPSDMSTRKALPEMLQSKSGSEALRWSWSTTRVAATKLGLSRINRWGHQSSLDDFIRE